MSRPPPGARGEPAGFTWTTAYSLLKAHYLQCWARQDMQGIQKAGAAIEAADEQVTAACLRLCPPLRASEVLAPVWAYITIEQHGLQFELILPGSSRSSAKSAGRSKPSRQALARKLAGLDLRGV